MFESVTYISEISTYTFEISIPLFESRSSTTENLCYYIRKRKSMFRGPFYILENLRATLESLSYAFEAPHPIFEIIKYIAEIQNYIRDISNLIFRLPADRFEFLHAFFGYRQNF